MTNTVLYIGNKCFSSWSLRPWIALKQAGVPFEERLIRLRTPETKAAIAEVSPGGKLPVLHHGSTIVWESLAILEYLAEAFPRAGLWPADPVARAHARSVATEMHGGFPDLRQQWGMNLRRARGAKPLEGAAVAQGQRIEAIWVSCREAHKGKGPFLFGAFSNADAMYAPVVTRFHTYGGQLSPVIRDYVDAVLALPAMREWYAAASAEPWPEPSPDD